MRGDSLAPRAHLDVTPMLDVLLVIIVVFLLVQIQTIWPSMYAQTPEPCHVGCDGESTQLLLEIGPPDRYAINGEVLPFASLGARLAGILHARTDRSVFVKGDSGVSYDRVMSAIDVARGAGAQVIGIVPKDVRRN